VMPLRWLARSFGLHRSARTRWRRRTTPPRPSTPWPRSRSRVDEASNLRTDNPQVLAPTGWGFIGMPGRGDGYVDGDRSLRRAAARL
jgi:hypothetical protein